MRPIYLISQSPYPGTIHIPVLHIRYLTPSIDFSLYCGLIFTSKQAIKALEHYPDEWKRMPCICVSESTAEAAHNAGVKEITIAGGYGESIPDLPALQQWGGKWLYLRPKTIATEWVDRGRKNGADIEEAIVYETLCANMELLPVIENNGVLIFTSPSSIECFLKRYSILESHKVVVIGKTTQEALPNGIPSVLSDSTSLSSCFKKAQEIAIY